MTVCFDCVGMRKTKGRTQSIEEDCQNLSIFCRAARFFSRGRCLHMCQIRNRVVSLSDHCQHAFQLRSVPVVDRKSTMSSSHLFCHIIWTSFGRLMYHVLSIEVATRSNSANLKSIVLPPSLTKFALNILSLTSLLMSTFSRNLGQGRFFVVSL